MLPTAYTVTTCWRCYTLLLTVFVIILVQRPTMVKAYREVNNAHHCMFQCFKTSKKCLCVSFNIINECISPRLNTITIWRAKGVVLYYREVLEHCLVIFTKQTIRGNSLKSHFTQLATWYFPNFAMTRSSKPHISATHYVIMYTAAINLFHIIQWWFRCPGSSTGILSCNIYE